MAPPFIVGVDATRNRSGGAIAHLAGLMSHGDPRDHGIEVVHLWAHQAIMQMIPEQPWLTKHPPHAAGHTLSRELWWQFHTLPQLLKRHQCHIVFNTDAGSVCPARNSVTLSQDMLSFEPGEMRRYGVSKARARLEVLKAVQACSLQRARTAIFLTEYARRTICSQIGELQSSVVIPHGIDQAFTSVGERRRPFPTQDTIRILYVSNTAPYKHQWHVVEAVHALRQRGKSVSLRLVGGGHGPAQQKLEQTLTVCDPKRNFVEQTHFLAHSEIPSALAAADIFVFASSCENLPITLLEAMAADIPICSSNRGPMPEVLGDGACYFDPESSEQIATALERVIDDERYRSSGTAAARLRAQQYNWSQCASDTWRTLADACADVISNRLN